MSLIVATRNARITVRPIRVAQCACGAGDATHEVVVRTDDARSDDQLYYRCQPCAHALRLDLERALGGQS